MAGLSHSVPVDVLGCLAFWRCSIPVKWRGEVAKVQTRGGIDCGTDVIRLVVHPLEGPFMACWEEEVQGSDVKTERGGETHVTNCPREMVAKVQLAAIQTHVAKLRRGLIRKERPGWRFKHIHHYCALLYLACPRPIWVGTWQP